MGKYNGNFFREVVSPPPQKKRRFKNYSEENVNKLDGKLSKYKRQEYPYKIMTKIEEDI